MQPSTPVYTLSFPSVSNRIPDGNNSSRFLDEIEKLALRQSLIRKWNVVLGKDVNLEERSESTLSDWLPAQNKQISWYTTLITISINTLLSRAPLW